LKFFTDLKKEKIDQIARQDINKLKVILANEATKILHGKNKSLKAEKTAIETFKLGKISENLPLIKISKTKLESGIDFLELLVANKILMSKGEVRRAIKNNGIKINDQLINSEKKVLGLEDFENETMKLSFGKKKHYIFKII